jgi:hypothetical protein
MRTSVVALGMLFYLAGCRSREKLEAEPEKASPAPAPSRAPAPRASSDETEAPAAAAARCSKPVAKLVEALAIPQGSTGGIEIVLSDHPLSCSYWSGRRFDDSCGVWRARIYLPPRSQHAGKYRLEKDFAFLDRNVTASGGAWLDASICEDAGGDLKGELQIVAIEQDRIKGRICGSHTGDGWKNPGLIDGSFEARRCPACGMTRDPCQTDEDCCAANCGGGTCHP